MRRKILWITFWTTMAYWLGGVWGCAAPVKHQAPMTRGHAPLGAEVSPVTTAPAPTDEATALTAPVPTAGVSAAVATTAPEGSVGSANIPATNIAVAPTTRPATDIALLSETQPSLDGLDRSKWSKVGVRVADGRVKHYRIYYQDLKFGGGQPGVAGPSSGAKPATGTSAAGGTSADAAGSEPAADPLAGVAVVRGSREVDSAQDLYDWMTGQSHGPAAQRDTAAKVPPPSVEQQINETLAPAAAGNWLLGANAFDALVQPLKFPLDLLLEPVNFIRQPRGYAPQAAKPSRPVNHDAGTNAGP